MQDGPKTRRYGLVLVIPLLALTGCVHVNLPEHMVSDTIDAGKDLYRSLAHPRDERVKPEQVDGAEASR